MKLSDFTQPFRHHSAEPLASPNISDDLGFGDKIIASGGRLINRDGSFNIERKGYRSWAPYQSLVEMNWKQFALIVFIFYLAINALFALAFIACGRECLSGVDPNSPMWEFFSQCFFFSIQTFTTVGYGSISPNSFSANFIASMDALVGLMSFALATGLVFARFSKPKAQILFSKNAIITPYRHPQTGLRTNSLQFRLVNVRNNKLINLEVKVVMTWLESTSDGNLVRRFAALNLERHSVTLFPLNWTIVHPIDENSPLYGKDGPDLSRVHSEILIMIEGYDDTFAQNVHDSSSYTCKEIEWGVKFARMYHAEKGYAVLEIDKLNETIPVEEE